MFIQLFRDVGQRREDYDIEMLDLETLRTRIGAGGPRPTKRPRDAVMMRYDGRTSSPRTWRDIARLSR